jgi:hypothetical protein
MNNEWNSEVVTDVSESDITVDQEYNATSGNPQSGTAVAQAVAQAGGTVDQQYNASSTNAQSGTAVAGAIAGVKQVPASTSADADKVLTVSSEGVPGWAPAQGGGSSYTAGDGITIANSEISADFDTVQHKINIGSDFTFKNATGYTSTLENSNQYIKIPTNEATLFTLPASTPMLPTGTNAWVAVEIVNWSGTVLETLMTGRVPLDFGSTTQLPQEYYKQLAVPANYKDCFIRIGYKTVQYATNYTYFAYSDFSTSTNCFFIQYTGELALASFMPKVVVNQVAMTASTDYPDYFEAPIPSSGGNGLSIASLHNITPSAVVKVQFRPSSSGNYITALASDSAVAIGRFNGTMRVRFMDASGNDVPMSAWGSNVPYLTVLAIG